MNTEGYQHRSSATLTARYLALASDLELWELPLPAALERLTRAAADALHLRRTGVWLWEESEQAFVLQRQYDAETGRYTSGVALKASDNATYFAALRADRAIAASDALTDFRTREFAEQYLRPQGIGAVLDATVRRAGQTVGMVCLAHVGGPRL